MSGIRTSRHLSVADRLQSAGGMWTARVTLASLGLATSLLACGDASLDVDHEHTAMPVHAIVAEDVGPVAAVSVAAFDKPVIMQAGDATLPVEARLLVISANGGEPELDAIRSVLDHRGVPYDVFVASQATLSTSLLQSSTTHGNYQGIVLTSTVCAV